jgi:hypothetical protein
MKPAALLELIAATFAISTLVAGAATAGIDATLDFT